ncbi:Uncharacterized protein FKW44_021783, partial [Caligus rogercresseyi]
MRDVYSNLEEIVAILVSMKGMISNSELSRLTSMPLRSVQRLMKSLEDCKDPRKVNSRAPRPDLSTRKVRDMDFVNKVQEIIDEHPTRSLSSIAEELEVGETTIQNS